jgi:hypothetical protein
MSSRQLLIGIFDSLGWISIVLQVVLTLLLLRGPFRKFPLILAYCVIQFLLIAGENYAKNYAKEMYSTLYWTDEIMLNLLLFLMVITFTYKALGDSALRPAMGKILLLVCVIVLSLPFLIFKGAAFHSVPWFNHTSQLLSFGGAVLNLGLWTALVSNRKRDPQLLSVSAGLGIAVTGAAISYGIRGYFRKEWLWAPDFFMSATFVICLCIWCWAFRSTEARESPLLDRGA